MTPDARVGDGSTHLVRHPQTGEAYSSVSVSDPARDLPKLGSLTLLSGMQVQTFVRTGERKAMLCLLSSCGSASSSAQGGPSRESKIAMLQTLKFFCWSATGSNPFKSLIAVGLPNQAETVRAVRTQLQRRAPGAEHAEHRASRIWYRRVGEREMRFFPVAVAVHRELDVVH